MSRLRFVTEMSVKAGLSMSCVCGRSEELPFPDGSFDLVLSRSTLQYTEISRATGELTRVLKPGGALVLVENMARNPFLLLFRAFRGMTGNRIRIGPYTGNKAGAIKRYATVSMMKNLSSGLIESGNCFCHLFRPVSLGLCHATDRTPWAMKLDRAVERLDSFLLRKIPFLQRYSWAGAVWGRKPLR